MRERDLNKGKEIMERNVGEGPVAKKHPGPLGLGRVGWGEGGDWHRANNPALYKILQCSVLQQGVNKEFSGVNRCESAHIFSSLQFVLSGQVATFSGF